MSAEATDAMKHRYLTDAEFHAQVWRHAAIACTHDSPCSMCLERSLVAVSKVPFLGHSGPFPCFGNRDGCQNCGGSASLGGTQEPWRDEHGNPFCCEECMAESRDFAADLRTRRTQ